VQSRITLEERDKVVPKICEKYKEPARTLAEGKEKATDLESWLKGGSPCSKTKNSDLSGLGGKSLLLKKRRKATKGVPGSEKETL